MKNIICCPYYKEQFTIDEEKNLKITEFYNKQIDKYFLLPQSLNTKYFCENFPDWKILHIEDHHFENIISYNKLLLSNKLYKLFIKYEYLIICQSDAIILKNINHFNNNFDYIGAPWLRPIKYFFLDLNLGNGGLSIRKINTFRRITTFFFFLKKLRTNEDIIFSYLGKIGLLKIPQFEEAKYIFVEMFASQLDNWDNVFGFHALNKWNPDLQKKIFESHTNL